MVGLLVLLLTMPIFPGFIGGSNTSQSLIADAERTVNLFVESTQSQTAKTVAALMPTPGYQRWSAAGVTEVGSRGAVVANGRLFFLIGAKLYEFSMTGVPTARGTVVQDANLGQLVWNGVIGGQLGICSGGNVYSYDLTTNTLSGILLTGGYTHLCYAKGYGLALNPTTGKVNLSNLNNLSVWGAGTFFQRSNFADPWQAMWSDSSALVWLVGTESFEVWSLSNPSSTQPFAPLSGLSGRFGIAAPFAYGVSGVGMVWIARNGPEGGAIPVWTQGSSPQAVGTYAVNTAIAGYLKTAKISDAELLMYHDAGHTFANIAFPSAPHTWALDLEARGWAERGKWNSLNGSYELWTPRVHADCFGKHLVGDRTTSAIWEMSTAFATETDGTGIRRLRRTPGTTQEGKRIPINRLFLLMDTGVADQNIDPIATMRMSTDGGRTFGNERQASYGKVGRYQQRVYWDRCGAPEFPVVECTWSSLAPVRVVNAYYNNMEEAA